MSKVGDVVELEDGTTYVVRAVSPPLVFQPAEVTADPFGIVEKYSPDQPRDYHGRFASVSGTIAARTVASGGSTSTPHGRPITSGKSVSPYPEHSRVYRSGRARQPGFISKATERFRQDKARILAQPGHAIGTWLDPETGHLWLDVVVVVKSHAEARTLARRHNQIAYFDLDTGTEVRTGGTGFSKRLGRLRRGFLSRGSSRASAEDDGVGPGGRSPGDRGRVAGFDPFGVAKVATPSSATYEIDGFYDPATDPIILSPRAAAIYDVITKYNQSQRRAPKGTPIGGQWVDDDTGQGDDLLSPGAEHGPTFTPTGRPSAPNNPDATRVSSMPPEFLKLQCGKLAAVGLTSADLERNIEALFLRARDEFPEVYEMGKDWYAEANERIGEHAAENGFDKDVAIGMTAAMSPSSEWGQNIAMVGELMRQHNANDRVYLSLDERRELRGRDDVHAAALARVVGADGVGPRFNSLPPEQAAWAFMVTGQRKGLLSEVPTLKGVWALVQFATGSANITKAIRMARGENISVAMGGQHKIRSFFNNLKDPHNRQGRGDVTIDTHAASVAQAFRMPMVSNRADKTFWNGSSKSSNQNGLYPIYADAYRAVAKKHGLHPHQLQAIAWVTWQHVRHEYPGIVARKGKDINSAPSKVTDDYTEARVTTRARYGVQVGKRDGVGPRYASQISDWERYQDGEIDYQTYLQRIGSDNAY